MKKAVNVSLAQTLFTIEEDAYAKLDQYLKSIRSHFSYTEDGQEIIEDIETRIAEQFLEVKKKIITLKEVEAVIASMGTVEDFEGEEGIPHMEIEEAPVQRRKKLYRNTNDKVIAGVCSGIATYFNIDPVWVRILFLAFIVLTYGFGIILYIILALLIPEAKTASQKLEMEGTPVTLETMRENVQEKEERSEKRRSTFIKVLAWPFKALGKLIQIIVGFLLPIIRVLVGLFIAFLALGGMVGISFFASMALMSNENYIGLPLAEILSTPLLYMTVITGYLVALIPLIVIFILSISLIRKKNMLNMKLGLTMLFVWLVALVMAGVGAFQSVDRMSVFVQNSPIFEESTREIQISSLPKTLNLTEGIELELIQGDEAKLTLKGRTKDLESFELQQEDGELTLGRSDMSNLCFFCHFALFENSPIEATLVLPSVDAIHTQYGSNLEIQTWEMDKPLDLTLGHGSHAELNIKAPEIYAMTEYGSNLELNVETLRATIEASAGSWMEIDGIIKEANFKANYGAVIDAEEANIQNVKAFAAEGSNINLGVVETLEATAEFGGTINYEGSPEIIKNEETGGSITGDSEYFDEDEDAEDQFDAMEDYDDDVTDEDIYFDEMDDAEEPATTEEISDDENASAVTEEATTPAEEATAAP